MRRILTNFFAATTLATATICFASSASKLECVSFVDASKHVGTNQCVSGTVLQIESGRNGTRFLSFCNENVNKNDQEKGKTCPFTVVVFPADLKKMGDIRQLEGRQIEIKGTVQDHDGRAEIILHNSRQLLGDAAFRLFPPVPVDYDVERQGHNSAGKYSSPKAAKKTTTRQGNPTSIEDPGEPQ
jgi:hypothetical protein